MSFSRTTVVDSSPTGDSVKQAVLDVDTDLTNAFTHINTLNTALALKLDTSQKGAASGVAELDSTALVKRVQLVTRAYDIGDIKPWPSEDLPSSGDWLECDGADLDRTTYADLFAIIGYTFGGSGDTFNLPDLRGDSIRGWDHGRGLDPTAAARKDINDDTVGDAVGSIQDDAVGEFPAKCGYLKSDTGTAPGQYMWNVLTPYIDQITDFTMNYGIETDTHPHNTAFMYVIRWR